MRKSYFLLLAATMVASTSMAQQLRGSIASKNAALGKTLLAPAQKATGDLPSDVITETPDGNFIAGTYVTAKGYYPWGWEEIYSNTSDGNAMDLVEADTKFYIKNPFSMNVTNSWLEGDIVKAKQAGDPDTVVMRLPQKVSEYKYAFNISVTETSTQIAYKVSSNQEARFTWDGTTLTKLGTDVLGEASSEGAWDGYGDYAITATRQTDVPTALPQGAVPVKGAFSYYNNYLGTQLSEIEIANDGSDVYLGGIDGQKHFWVKGTINGDKAEFRPQYLGIDSTALVHRYFEPITLEVSIDPDDPYSYDYTATFKDLLTYDYDAASGKLTTTEDFSINPGKNNPSTYNVFSKTQITPYLESAATPATPEGEIFNAFDASSGYTRLVFKLPSTSADGTHYLDPAKLYYQCYLEKDKPFTFTTSDYKTLTEDMTEVPYLLNNQDFYIANSSRIVRFYSDVKTVGIQAIYKGGDTSTYSPITWYPAEPSAVDGIASGKTVASESYTDLSGRQVSEPASGFYVKTVRYTDGTVSTSKIVK